MKKNAYLLSIFAAGLVFVVSACASTSKNLAPFERYLYVTDSIRDQMERAVNLDIDSDGDISGTVIAAGDITPDTEQEKSCLVVDDSVVLRLAEVTGLSIDDCGNLTDLAQETAGGSECEEDLQCLEVTDEVIEKLAEISGLQISSRGNLIDREYPSGFTKTDEAELEQKVIMYETQQAVSKTSL